MNLDMNQKSEDPDNSVVNNRFANDGSFLELFKKMQKQMNDKNIGSDCDKCDNDLQPNDLTVDEKDKCVDIQNDKINSVNSEIPAKASVLNTNKRRIKTLKVGLIKKQRNDSGSGSEDVTDGSAWSRYMREVRKYKEKYGDDNDKNRPLVK